MNDYFCSQSIPPDTNIPLPPFKYNTDARLSSITVTPSIIKNILIDLNTTTSMGSDNISNKILKECANSLCYPLSILFKKSLLLGVFPTSWKEALVTSIFKKDNRQLKSNYRPISLLSCIFKVFERIIHTQLYSYCNTNNLLNECNSGFKKFDSAINRLLSLTKDIQDGLDKHKEIILIFMDISKAFDRVWHPGLIFKLKQLGIDGSLLRWFKSYLSNRSQRVALGGLKSPPNSLHAGVPQGSILGPLLFLIFINDLPNDLQTKASLFADDTTLMEEIDIPHDSIDKINADLKRIQDWALQ
jgi:hypothetical protein